MLVTPLLNWLAHMFETHCCNSTAASKLILLNFYGLACGRQHQPVANLLLTPLHERRGGGEGGQHVTGQHVVALQREVLQLLVVKLVMSLLFVRHCTQAHLGVSNPVEV